MRGRQIPRRYTPPLVAGAPGPCGCGCALTEDTSYGYDVVQFAITVLGITPDPWQRWLAIHLGELLPDGRPRFRIALTIVARQNGKTFLSDLFILYWMFVESVGVVLGTSTDRSYAKKQWSRICEMAKDNKWLSDKVAKIRLTLGEESFSTTDKAEYLFAANNGRAGRSLTVQRWLCDELREHAGTETWDAAYGAMAAAPYGQVLAITNQGDVGAVKLHELHDAALAHLETGDGDERLGLFEWSAPEGSDPGDAEALAYANPNLGTRVDAGDLVAEGERAKAAGGEALAAFTVERMCLRVAQMVPAFNLDAWSAAGGAMVALDMHRDKVAVCFDVALDRMHATLVAAAEVDGRFLVDVVAAWDGPTCTADLVAELPAILARVAPRVIGWFPAGPAATVVADLAAPKGGRAARRWAPRRTVVQALTEATTAVCVGAVDLVTAGRVRHGDDPLLTAHVEGSTPAWRGDAFVFQRRGRSSIDASYAMAGALHLARTLPPPPAPLEIA